ncbi:MAG: heavy-metal-associated domain-containing protein [Bacteroidetes bacterium]|nr:heavy-metal-associated domain-containing protein [Bacteroidota bacterium]
MRILILFLLVSKVGIAQVKPLVTTTIKIPQALCIQCKNRLEYQVKRLNGVQEFVVNYRKGEARVKYLTDRTDIEQVKTMISNTGYDADDILANPHAYNRLPITCKKKINKNN